MCFLLVIDVLHYRRGGACCRERGGACGVTDTGCWGQETERGGAWVVRATDGGRGGSKTRGFLMSPRACVPDLAYPNKLGQALGNSRTYCASLELKGFVSTDPKEDTYTLVALSPRLSHCQHGCALCITNCCLKKAKIKMD